LNGRCFCGFVRYVAQGARFFETNCHCSTCRQVSGAPFVAWFSIPASGFSVVSGELARFASSEHGERTFCPRCGTPITFRSSDFPDQIDITTCSLEDPEKVPPKDHTYVRSQLEWIKLADGLPRFPQAR
jgi:hypothetical protein